MNMFIAVWLALLCEASAVIADGLRWRACEVLGVRWVPSVLVQKVQEVQGTQGTVWGVPMGVEHKFQQLGKGAVEELQQGELR